MVASLRWGMMRPRRRSLALRPSPFSSGIALISRDVTGYRDERDCSAKPKVTAPLRVYLPLRDRFAKGLGFSISVPVAGTLFATGQAQTLFVVSLSLSHFPHLLPYSRSVILQGVKCYFVELSSLPILISASLSRKWARAFCRKPLWRQLVKLHPPYSRIRERILIIVRKVLLDRRKSQGVISPFAGNLRGNYTLRVTVRWLYTVINHRRK